MHGDIGMGPVDGSPSGVLETLVVVLSVVLVGLSAASLFPAGSGVAHSAPDVAASNGAGLRVAMLRAGDRPLTAAPGGSTATR